MRYVEGATAPDVSVSTLGKEMPKRAGMWLVYKRHQACTNMNVLDRKVDCTTGELPQISRDDLRNDDESALKGLVVCPSLTQRARYLRKGAMDKSRRGYNVEERIRGFMHNGHVDPVRDMTRMS